MAGTVGRLPTPSTTGPTPAIVELDGWSIEPFEDDDAPLLVELLGQRGHRYVLDVPIDDAVLRTILGELRRQPWTMPVAFVRDDACAGFGTTALANVRSLNASIGALFVDPDASAIPLAMYVRHLFWTFPLHRLYTQIPDMDLTREYVELLRSVGFAEEGRLTSHAMIGGQTFDMVALGLLRADFERWIDEHEPRLRFRP
jgi:hypothetical protein